MGISGLVAALLICLLLSGGYILARGIKGDRISPYRACRACGFDLSGHVLLGLCPECGANVLAARAVRSVKRRRRPKLMIWGAALVLLSLAVPSSLLIDAATSGGLTGLSPSWLLVIETQCLGARTPERVGAELLARWSRGELSNAMLRRVSTSLAGARSADERMTGSLNLLVGAAAAKGVISKDVLAQHVVTQALLDVQLPERTRPNGSFAKGMINWSDAAGRVPADGVWVVRTTIAELEISGKRVATRAPVSQEELLTWAPAQTVTPSCITGMSLAALPPINCVPDIAEAEVGRRTLRVHYRVEVFYGVSDQTPGKAETVREYSVEVVSNERPLVATVSDASLTAQIKSRISARVMRSNSPGSPSGWYLDVDRVQPAPAMPVVEHPSGERVGGAWRVAVEFDGRRQQTGWFKVVWARRGDPHVSIGWGSPKVPAGARSCRVILIPDIDRAVEREAVDVMPADEIVFENVPVR